MYMNLVSEHGFVLLQNENKYIYIQIINNK